jgi:type II secretory pathway pseudopilin PulG
MRAKGFTALELVVLLAMIGILFAGGILNIKQLFKKSKSAAEEVVAFLNLVRSRSIAETRYLLVKPTDSASLQVFSVPDCASQQLSNYPLRLNLPSGARWAFTNWEICYNSKGLSNASGIIQLQENESTSTIEISLGGLPKLVS